MLCLTSLSVTECSVSPSPNYEQWHGNMDTCSENIKIYPIFNWSIYHHHPQKFSESPLCGTTLGSIHESVTYNCNICQHKANRKSNLTRHIKSVHLKYTSQSTENSLYELGILKNPHFDPSHDQVASFYFPIRTAQICIPSDKGLIQYIFHLLCTSRDVWLVGSSTHQVSFISISDEHF